ncbi:MAG: CdaR family protein [Desulfobulbaceae bacterium]|nr:CdaR family protein [Desulfobulbaceae bacterium]
MEKLVKQIMGLLPKQKDNLPWTQNWAIKTLSLLFALFLWYFVVGEDKVDMTVQIPVEIINMPRDLVISNQFKKQLEVTIAGPRGLIRGIANQHVSRAVDLSKATPGSLLVRNDEETISFPRGIRVLRVQPPYITLLLDRLIQRELPIKAPLSGTPANGYKIESVTIEPAVLSLTGPQAILGDQEQLATTPIDLHNLKASITRQVNLDLKQSLAELIGETTVTVKVRIIEETVLKQISNIPVAIIGANPPLTAVVNPAAVAIKTEIPLSLSGNQQMHTLFNATVSAADLPPGTHSVPVRVETGMQAKIIDITPATVTVSVRKPPAHKK